MNLVFIQGKIISEIDFKFIINSNNKSIAIFKIELFNKSIVTAKAYNNLADYCYSKLKVGNLVLIKGFLNNKNEIIIKIIEK